MRERGRRRGREKESGRERERLKEMKDHCNANFTTSKKDTEDGTGLCNDLPCSCIVRLKENICDT